MIVTENQYSPDLKSENVQSSGMANFRLSKIPIGGAARKETTESSTLGLVMSSKPSHKNNNLSNKEIWALQPKKINSLMLIADESQKVSPSSILKPTTKYQSRENIAGLVDT